MIISSNDNHLPVSFKVLYNFRLWTWNNVFAANISEDSRLYTDVVTIQAVDRDSGPNARILYTFKNGNDGNGVFDIAPRSGKVRTKKK